jgi:hypothetical protein
LKNDLTAPTPFLLDTGLIYEQIGKNVSLNPLFEYFLANHGEWLDTIPAAEAEKPVSINAFLTGQELLVFNLLQEHLGELVAKDDIAKTMWGDTWESQYSDWAIDRLVSNLRTKLTKFGYEKTLKSLKGKGLMLV